MSDKFDISKFAMDVESAFILIGGEKSKVIYDWMIATNEYERIFDLVENQLMKSCNCFEHEDMDEAIFWNMEETEHDYYCPIRTVATDLLLALMKGKSNE